MIARLRGKARRDPSAGSGEKKLRGKREKEKKENNTIGWCFPLHQMQPASIVNQGTPTNE